MKVQHSLFIPLCELYFLIAINGELGNKTYYMYHKPVTECKI